MSFVALQSGKSNHKASLTASDLINKYNSPTLEAKGGIVRCSLYRSIRFINHIFEMVGRIVDHRLQEIVNITPSQKFYEKHIYHCTQAVHSPKSMGRSIRLYMQLSWSSKRRSAECHVKLSGGHEVIYYSATQCYRKYCIKMIYHGAKSRVRCDVGVTKELRSSLVCVKH